MSSKPARCFWLTLLNGALCAYPAHASMQAELSTSDPLGVFLSLAEINESISATLASIEDQVAEQSCNERAEKVAVVRAQVEFDSARSLQFSNPSPTNQNKMDKAQLALTVAQEQWGHTRQITEHLQQSLSTLNKQIASNSEQIARLGLLVEREHVTGTRWLEDNGRRHQQKQPRRQELHFVPAKTISAAPNPH